MHDCLIVGGGVIGLSIAWELSRRGTTVAVVDGQLSPHQTSWVGAGIFPPPQVLAKHDPLEQLRALSHPLHEQWSRELLSETGIDNQLQESGGIYIARSPAEAASLRVAMHQLAEDGVSVQELTRSDLQRLEPNLHVSHEIRASFRLRNEMQLRSPLHLNALTAACEQRDVEIRSDFAVTSVRHEQNTFVAESESGSVSAKSVCLCAGAWTSDLLKPFGVVLPVEPWRGQMILWKTDEPLLTNIINEGHRYFVPRRDGHLLVGATVEDEGFSTETTPEALAELSKFSCELIPALSEHQVKRSWAGIRPGTPDGRPYLDEVPGVTNLFVATGHFRSGLHLSPITAKCMADLMIDGESKIDLSAFRIQR